MKPNKFYIVSVILMVVASMLAGCGGSSAGASDFAPPAAQSSPVSLTGGNQPGSQVFTGVT